MSLHVLTCMCLDVCARTLYMCCVRFVWVCFVWVGLCAVFCVLYVYLCKCVKVIAHIYTIKVLICTQVYYSLYTLKGFATLSVNIKITTSGYHI